jgi:hypothetical protein
LHIARNTHKIAFLVLSQRICLLSKGNNAQPESNSPASAVLQGSDTASRAIAMLLPFVVVRVWDLPPAARMLKFVLSSFCLPVSHLIFLIISRNSVGSVGSVVHCPPAAPVLCFTEPTGSILCWFSRPLCWFTACQ